MSNQPIVVGVDGNPRSERAAEAAAELARATGSPLHVVCAYVRDQSAEVDAVNEGSLTSVAAASAAIAAEVAQHLRATVPTVTSAAVQARPVDALLGEAERLDARMIVVGNARVQGIARVLGSIAGGVAHHATCDVYIANTN